MPVSPTSYSALATQCGVAMLAASTTFQTLVGAANSTAALSWIIESFGGNPRANNAQDKATATDGTLFATTSPHGIVHLRTFNRTLAGVGYWNSEGTTEIAIYQARFLTGEKPPEQLRRARNVLDGIRADIDALFGTQSTYYATGNTSEEGPGFPDDTGADAGLSLGVLLINWYA